MNIPIIQNRGAAMSLTGPLHDVKIFYESPNNNNQTYV